jgi:hypothetical protein
MVGCPGTDYFSKIFRARAQQNPKQQPTQKVLYSVKQDPSKLHYSQLPGARKVRTKIPNPTHGSVLTASQIPKVNCTDRRNAGRMDGAQWNGGSFICGSQLGDEQHPYDTFDQVLCHCSICWGEEPEVESIPMPVIGSLLDIARPAKPKGKHPYVARFVYRCSFLVIQA